MTLVLPINRLCEHTAFEGGTPEFPGYQALWEAECFSKNSISEQILNKGTLGPSSSESHYRGISNPITTSRIAYFKRKYVEDEDFHPQLNSCYNKALPAFEERAHVLRMSLEKLKNIEDPEVFLRRSVLINNLMKRIRGEIIMQSDWCLSAYTLGGMSPQDWLVSQNCPYRKRLRISKESCDSFQTCCFYQECGGHYFSMPISVNNGGSPSFSSSSSLPGCSHHSSSSPLPGCSHQTDLCLDHTAVYRNNEQISSAEIVISNAKYLINQNVPKLNKKKVSKTNWERDEINVRCRQTETELPKMYKGGLSDCPETESDEKSSMNETWKKLLQRRDSIAGDKHSYKKGNKI